MKGDSKKSESYISNFIILPVSRHQIKPVLRPDTSYDGFHRSTVVPALPVNSINVIQGCEHERFPHYLHAYSLPVQIRGEDNETR